jgi:hypothetical protein
MWSCHRKITEIPAQAFQFARTRLAIRGTADGNGGGDALMSAWRPIGCILSIPLVKGKGVVEHNQDAFLLPEKTRFTSIRDARLGLVA